MNWLKIIATSTICFIMGMILGFLITWSVPSVAEATPIIIRDTIEYPVIVEKIKYKNYKVRQTVIDSITVTYRGELLKLEK